MVLSRMTYSPSFFCYLCKQTKRPQLKSSLILVGSHDDMTNATICLVCNKKLHDILISREVSQSQRQQSLDVWGLEIDSSR